MSILKAIELLRSGEVIGLPTETVYGLAGDIEQALALEKIFSTKERPFFDPLIVHVDTIDKARALSSNWTPLHEALASLWPGPLTLVADRNSHINPLITAGLEQVAIRIPRHPIALEILSHFKGLAAPSANKFGKTSPTCAQHVSSEFQSNVFVIDGGQCEVGIESTVVSVANQSTVHIYRPGFYSSQDLKKILKTKGFDVAVSYAESPVAPGQLKHHYMPSIPVLVGHKKSFKEVLAETTIQTTKPVQMDLGVDPRLAARLFYQTLRELSLKDHDAIVISTQDIHLCEDWMGLMNRLKKAASFWA